MSASLYICIFERSLPHARAPGFHATRRKDTPMLIFSTKHPLHVSHPLPYQVSCAAHLDVSPKMLSGTHMFC